MLRHEVIRIFSSDDVVKERAVNALPYLCIMMFVMGVGQIFNGSLDACCLNSWRNYVTFFSLLVVGVPAAVYLALGTSLELKGLWLGLLAGATVRLLAFAVMYTQIDLPAVIQAARERQELTRAEKDLKDEHEEHLAEETEEEPEGE
eukprot:Hpha_TRINITY_DN14894_c0_g1::TRINITY_DN14894_c0_g1_i2::g.169701::m.169701